MQISRNFKHDSSVRTKAQRVVRRQPCPFGIPEGENFSLCWHLELFFTHRSSVVRVMIKVSKDPPFPLLSSLHFWKV